jgi:membrane protein implicated in regulation of membrane protease activity
METSTPGWKTTEFWLTLIATIAPLVLASGLLTQFPLWTKIVSVLVSALSAYGYTRTRSEYKLQRQETTLRHATALATARFSAEKKV